MNGYLKAKGNDGAVTIHMTNFCYRMIVIGSSCKTSVAKGDGLIGSFTVVPKEKKEVVAIAIVNDRETINQVLLLDVSLEDKDKATVDLEMEFASTAEAIGQIVISPDKHSCFLRVIVGDLELVSDACTIGADPKDRETEKQNRHDPYDLCRLLVGRGTIVPTVVPTAVSAQ